MIYTRYHKIGIAIEQLIESQFHTIDRLRGSADARTMAEGVSHAMICTLSGLAVSISGLYPVHYFSSRARRKTELYSDEFEF